MIERAAKACRDAMRERRRSTDPQETEGEYAAILARAVIKSLREPSEAVCDAGADCANANGGYISGGEALLTFNVMIDAILAEEKTDG